MAESELTALDMKACVIVCSDRASSGTYIDVSGKEAASWLSSHQFKVDGPSVIPDSREMLLETLEVVSEDNDLIVISGGTGLGSRDITPQTLDEYCDYHVAGFGELLRRESAQYSLNSYLSRCGGWVKGRKLYLALPGSPKAVKEQLDILKDLLPHALLALHGKCQHRRRVEP